MTNFLIGYPDIPLNSTVSASKTEDSSFPAKNLITGSRGKSHQLSTSTTDDYYLQFDRGSGNSSSSNYCSIQRASLLAEDNANAFRLRGSTQPYNLPSTITGLKLWLDATRGVAKDGSNKVSQWDDQSGEGNHATQGAGANQPTWLAPASGLNGNAALSFDGSASYMTANGVSSLFSGDDKPFTAIVAARVGSVASGSRMVFEASRSSSNTPFHGFYQNASSNFNSFRRGDSGSVVTVTGGTPTVGTHIFSVVFTGTECSAWDNAANIINAGSQNTVAMTIDRFYIGCEARPSPASLWNGYICELCIYNSALGTADRESLEAYMTSKWSTAASASETALDSATLYGPRAEDYVSSFSASTAYRYWWAQYGASGSGSKYPHSKLHFGSWFDFGREPIYPMLQKREAYSSGSREARYIFECEWQGITDSVMEDFIDKIVKYKDVSPVILYDASDYCLNDMRQMHAWLTSAEFDKTSHNSNTIRCVFEEAL